VEHDGQDLTTSSVPLCRQAGFTLLEMLVVVTIMGFVLGLVITRGPMRSQTLEMQAAVNQVAQGLRLARSKAIATNTTARLTVDLAQRSFRIDNGKPTALPPSLSVAMTAISEETIGQRLAAIRFNGDGSASGGHIDLTSGSRQAQVGVDWLTGRISVSQPH
jgi:general secretion pathway protein H